MEFPMRETKRFDSIFYFQKSILHLLFGFRWWIYRSIYQAISLELLIEHVFVNNVAVLIHSAIPPSLELGHIHARVHSQRIPNLRSAVHSSPASLWGWFYNAVFLHAEFAFSFGHLLMLSAFIECRRESLDWSSCFQSGRLLGGPDCRVGTKQVFVGRRLLVQFLFLCYKDVWDTKVIHSLLHHKHVVHFNAGTEVVKRGNPLFVIPIVLVQHPLQVKIAGCILALWQRF